ncbi:bacteriocin immunity protein, partial [Pseudomonas chlororaphis]
PENGADSSAVGIIKAVKDWRRANGLPGFKAP